MGNVNQDSMETRFDENLGECFSKNQAVRCKQTEPHPCTGWHSEPYLNEEEKERLGQPRKALLHFIRSEIHRAEQHRDKALKDAMNAKYPRTFVVEASYGNGYMQRGIQESTHIRRPLKAEEDILNFFDALLKEGEDTEI